MRKCTDSMPVRVVDMVRDCERGPGLAPGNAVLAIWKVFAKYYWKFVSFLLVRGLAGAKAEISIATMAYNLKRITKCAWGSQTDEGARPRLIERPARFANRRPRVRFCRSSTSP